VPIEGEIIGGRYRLDRLIGKGGMSSVWGGVHLALDRRVAVKFLHVRNDDDTEALCSQFLREARIAAAVRHRNVVDVLDFGTTDHGVPFMVMEVLEGETLGSRLGRSPPLAVNELIDIINLTLRGLTAVHDSGIVHRDLKPENIFLQSDASGKYPKIFDFGISRCLDLSGPRSALTTKEGLLVGTPHYMSPEQVRGMFDIDQRTDIYSMGVILYEALTGRLPFDAQNIADLIIMIIQTTAPPVFELRPEVGREISDVVSRAMHRNREARFANAREMQTSLLRAAERRFGAIGRPISVMPRPSRLSAAEAREERVKDKVRKAGIKNERLKAISDDDQSDFDRETLPLAYGGQTPSPALSLAATESTTPFSWSIERQFPTTRLSRKRGSRQWLLAAALMAVLLIIVMMIPSGIINSKVDRSSLKSHATRPANSAVYHVNSTFHHRIGTQHEIAQPLGGSSPVSVQASNQPVLGDESAAVVAKQQYPLGRLPSPNSDRGKATAVEVSHGDDHLSSVDVGNPDAPSSSTVLQPERREPVKTTAQREVIPKIKQHRIKHGNRNVVATDAKTTPATTTGKSETVRSDRVGAAARRPFRDLDY
jgi:serine/threonine protein kinase